MNKKILSASLLLLTFNACQSNAKDTSTAQGPTEMVIKNESKESKINESSKATEVHKYRSDGFYNGIASEWLQIAFTADGVLESVRYWNTEDEKPVAFIISNFQKVEGEITGITATLQFPGATDAYQLGMVEGEVLLTHADGREQEFEYEMED